MINLLSAQFYRLRRDVLFWLLAAMMLALSAFNGWRVGADAALYSVRASLDKVYFDVSPMMALAYAVFTALFLGAEYGGGAIRGKLAVGKTRTQVYLANYCLCLGANLCLLLLTMLGGLTAALYMGGFTAGAGKVTLEVLSCVFQCAALTAVFVALASLCTNRALSSAGALLLALGLILGASLIYNVLQEPDYTSEMIITIDGATMGPKEPNPHYVAEPLRTVFQSLLYFLPTGQAILLSNQELGYPVWGMLCSLAIVLGGNLGGILAFRRKDLK